jgi:hypothetical protein
VKARSVIGSETPSSCIAPDFLEAFGSVAAAAGTGRHDALITPDLINLWPAAPLPATGSKETDKAASQSKGPQLSF